MGTLENKVVLVTGAGAGIGRATALHLHEQGATVVATTRTQDDADALAKEVDAEDFATRVLDVTDEDAVAAAVTTTTERFGRLDGLVNNAGVLVPGTVLDASAADYDRTFDVNVKGVFFGCKHALVAMRAGGGGSIVNIGSINSLGAEKHLALYTASKGAVLMLTKAIALDHAADGVRANAVLPGFVDTKLNVPHYEATGGRAALDEALPDFQPLGRPIEAVEIAQAVAFLLSDASSAITGTPFIVDGGVLSKA